MPASNDQVPRDTSPRMPRALSLGNLAVFGLVAMAPVAAFTMYGFVFITSGGAITPAYLIGAAGIALTALSFAQMASVMAQSGSVYGYAKSAIGGTVGFLGGWALLLDYMLLGSLTAVYGALYVASALPQIPQLAFLAVVFAILLASAIRGVILSSKVEAALLILQLGFCAVFIVLAMALILQLPDLSASDAPLMPVGSTMGTVLGGAALTIITFIGFDAISTLAEEVKGEHPGRKIGQATLLAVGLMLVVFVLVSWLLSVLATGLTLGDPATSAFEIVAARLPALATPLALICGLAVGIGGTQVCHIGSTRVVFAMARDGRLPLVLSRISGPFRSPIPAALLVLIVIAAISTVALDHADVLAGLVSFGALSGFFLVNLSVLNHFGLRQGSRAWARHWVAPILGMVVVAYIMAGINPLALKVGFGWMVAGVVIYALHRGSAAKAAASQA